MSEHDQLNVFLREIKDDPDDDTPRLILADWLQDRGDARGEFIHLQVIRSRLHSDDPKHDEIRKEELLLLRKHVFDWLGRFVDVCTCWDFARGFLRLSARANRLLEEPKLPPLEDWRWVEWLALTGMRNGDFERLARLGVTRSVNELVLSGERVGPIAPLLNADLAELRVLRISAGLPLKEIAALVRCPYLANLRVLDLRDNEVNDSTAKVLIDSPLTQSLERLDISNHSLSERGMGVVSDAFGRRVVM